MREKAGSQRDEIKGEYARSHLRRVARPLETSRLFPRESCQRLQVFSALHGQRRRCPSPKHCHRFSNESPAVQTNGRYASTAALHRSVCLLGAAEEFASRSLFLRRLARTPLPLAADFPANAVYRRAYRPGELS